MKRKIIAKGKAQRVPAKQQTTNLAKRLTGKCIIPPKLKGSMVSIKSRSLANLLISLPRGTLSKNKLIGALIILVSI